MISIMLTEKSKVYNFAGQSFEEALLEAQFAKKTVLEETIDIWMAQMLKVVEEERKELFLTMLRKGGVLGEKDVAKLRMRVRDVLTWLWFNSFVAGDRDIGEQVNFAQNEDDIAEFAKLKLSQLTIGQLREALDILNARLEMETDSNEKNRLKDRRSKYLNRLDQLVNERDLRQGDAISRQTLKDRPVTTGKEIETTSVIKTPRKVKESLVKTPKEPVVKTPKQPKEKPTLQEPTPEELQKRLGRKFTKEERAEVEVAARNLRDLRTRQQASSSDFMQDSDFGRVYLQTRTDYIARTYAGDTRENMTKVFNQMNDDYLNNKGKQSAPIQQYFEQKIMRKEGEEITATGEKRDRITIGGIPLETTRGGIVNIAGEDVLLPGVRVKPRANENLNKMREVKLYEEMKKQYVDREEKVSISKIRRIVETEVVAAFNMGRLHSLYANNVKFVRWVNDVENRRSGKVCNICTIRAKGTSEKLRKLNLKESLSGVYTLEEALTDRQLAVPSHPHCYCVLRPLTRDEENQLVAMGGALVKDSVAETAAAVTAIGGATVAGRSNANLATEDTDRSKWWYGAATVGGAAVAIGAAYFYLRKSLTAKYAANLMKQRGQSVVRTIEEKGLVKGLEVPDQNVLNQSLRLADDVDIEDSIPTPLKPSKAQIAKYPEWETPLTDLGELTPKNQELIENLVTNSSVDNTLVDQTYSAYHGSTIDNKVLEINLQERRTDLKRRNTMLQSAYEQGDTTTRPYLARTIIENEKAINRTDKMLSGISDRRVRAVEEGMMSKAELRTYFDRLEPFDVFDARGVDLKLADDKSFSTKIREVPKLDIVKRFAEEGVVDKDIKFLRSVERKLRNKETITPVEFQRFQSKLRIIERDRAITELALTRAESGTTVFNDITIYVRQGMEGVLGENTMRIYRKNETHKTLINNVSKKLYELKDATLTYKQKLTDKVLTDPFVKNLNINSSTVKSNAIKGREDAVKTIDVLLGDLNEKTVNDFLEVDVMKNVFGNKKADIDAFKLLSKTEQRTFLRKKKKELTTEANRIRTAEFMQASFTRFQKKWAMFGAPK